MSRSAEFDALKLEVSEKTRSIIFWTGAGISAPAIVGWAALRSQMLSALKAKAKALDSEGAHRLMSEHAQITASTDMWLQFQRLRDSLGPEKYEAEIKKALLPSDKEPVPELHSAVWALAPRGVVTLNLDLFTQRAAVAHPGKSTPINILPGKFGENLNVFKEKRPFVAYPHGHLDSPHLWTFTASELEQRFNDARYIEWLTILFRTTTVVFLGVTADDVAVGSLLDRISKRRIALTGHFWLTNRNDYETERWAQAHGINIISYENKTGKHEGLPGLLNDLRAPVKTEDAAKETPVITKQQLGVASALLAPDELVKESEETIRIALNLEAKNIFLEKDAKKRDVEYLAFLTKYGRAIHRSWYASTAENEGSFLGYHLTEEVAGGAFGTVFKAYDQDGEEVAVKILKTDNFRKSGFLKNFRRGVNSLRILTERNLDGVIKFIDAAEIPPTLVMNWTDGRSLTELVEAHQVNEWSERLTVASKLTQIIRTCHSLPERVLHRDLRPANIMIEDSYAATDEWRVVVLDFDLSWHKGAEDHSIMHSPAFGYLAPEQRKATQTTRSALVDSYGIGMTLYYMCVGVNPFPDQHLNLNWEKNLFQSVERTQCKEWRCVPRRFARLILNATRDDQLQRWTVTQMEGELESLREMVTGKKDPQILDVVTEEIALRTEHMQGYSWSDLDSAASLKFPNGLSLKLVTIPELKKIRFEAEWANSGTQDWNRIDRVLSSGLPKMIEALKRSLWTEVNGAKPYRGFTLVATIDANLASEDPVGAAKALDAAIGHATAITSF